ncbi:MAG: restriction endonuclease subunit S [Geobacteraceae bacterium]|nr:restriction endonuclease subunit S [Geobacteraceae bacterium]
MSGDLPTFPNNWNAAQIRRKLQGVDGIRIGPFGSALTLDQMVEEGYKVYGQENVISQDFTVGTRFLSPKKYAELKACSIASGDLLVTMMGTTGRCCVVPEEIVEGIMDSHLIRLRFQDHKVDPSFMALLIDKGHYVKEQIGAGGKGTIMSGLNSSIIKEVWVGLPDVATQKRIAKYVEAQTVKIDRLTEMRRRQMELLKEQRAAFIQQAVTRGLNPDTPMKDSGIPWLGEIPEHWEVLKIKRRCLVKRGASPRPIDDPKYFDDNGEYSWVRISDVTASDKYLNTTEQQLSELGASLSVKREPGDIFVSICGSVGKPIISQIKCCIHDGFVWFDRLKLDSEFLFYLFSSGEMFKGLGNWGTQLNLNTDIIGDIKIPVPPEDEQKGIAEHLDKQTVKFEEANAAYTRQLTFLTEFRAALINECVTGLRQVPE